MGKQLWQTVDPSSFLVDGYKRRIIFAYLPKRAAEREDLFRLFEVMAEKDESAEGIVADKALFLLRQLFAPKADHHHLTDLFLQSGHRMDYTRNENDL